MDNLSKRGHKADRRSREVFRYFQPQNPAALNSTWLPFGDESTSTASLASTTRAAAAEASTSAKTTRQGRARSSPNTTLTSFAKLAALSLGAERALITIIDRETQYILAEATRTINISNTSECKNEGDGLWLGTSTVKNSWSICQETIALESNEKAGEHKSLVVDNLEEDERFKDLPFVHETPNFRFYAGTPLVTENGTNIGCLFVLDPNPRAGVSNDDKTSLGTIASLVMDFLRVSRQASEGRRASRLSRGLTYFVDGSSSFIDKSQSSSQTGQTNLSKRSSSRLSYRSSSSASKRTMSSKHTGQPMQQNAQSSGSSTGEVLMNPSPGCSETSDDSAGSCQSTSSDQKVGQSRGNQWAFQRAANLLRESLELGREGGVSFWGLGNTESVAEGTGDFYSAETNEPAPLLALSSHKLPFSCSESSKELHATAQVDCTFLQQLVHRYPQGRLWSFHRDGTLTTSDEDGKSGQSGSENSNAAPENRRKRLRESEASMLNAFFPHASQIMFVPLWDAASSQWHSGAFCWTTQETSVFNPSIDLRAVLSFASSIMSECNRVDALDADRQKGNFIGKISHELRSPLHGVLAAAEFLENTDPSIFQNSLIETIKSCGHTLLDTMNQLLDFSKVLSSERQRRRNSRNRAESLVQSADNSSNLEPVTVTDVSQLLEEVVESVSQGHFFKQSTSAKIDQTMALSIDSAHQSAQHPIFEENVEVVLDISHTDWLYDTLPGSLRRIIMNILGNALKYTTEGHIIVHLEVEKRCFNITHRQGLYDEVKISVSDTGKGISETFLREKLFKPFAQEDPLVDGAGLGLSIVRGLVKEMGGRLRIESRLGEGTLVSVSLPLAHHVDKSDLAVTRSSTKMPDESRCDLQRIRQLCQHNRFKIWGFKSFDVDHNGLFWTTTGSYMTKWLSLELVPFNSDQPVDFVLGDEKDIASTMNEPCQPQIRSLLIFCKSPVDFQRRQARLSNIADKVVFVWLPCGPKKIFKAIFDLLRDESLSGNNIKSHPRTEEYLGLSQSFHPSLSVSQCTNPQAIVSVPTSHFKDIPKMSTPRQVEADSADQMAEDGVSSVSATAPASEEYPHLVDTTHKLSEKPRILVVEDNEINLKLMLTFLQKQGLQVLSTATNGRLAVKHVENSSHNYDIIFMDMSMPVMDGFEATRVIRSIEKETQPAEAAFIVAFTGLSSSLDENKAREAGVDLFMSKPVSFKQVTRLLNEWEAKRRRIMDEGFLKGAEPYVGPNFDDRALALAGSFSHQGDS